ncbi:MAG: AAA family ATPase [Planctomycetota bacterium]
MKENGVLRVIYLEAENVKRLKAVRLRPDKTLVRIEGRNAAGKTSVLDAIAAALGGGKQQPDLPVRKGAKKAKVVLDLGGLKVERRWTAGGGSVLEVSEKNGPKLASPQKILDKLVGDCTFDPLEFVRMKPGDQAAVLERLAGLDWTTLDEKREQLFAQRTEAKREAKQAAHRVGTPPPKPESMMPVDLAAVAEQQRTALEHNQAVEEAHRDASDMLAKAEATLESAKAEASKTRAAADRMKPIELTDARAELEAGKAHNDAIVAYKGYKERSALAEEASTKAEELNGRIERIDEEKAESLAAAKFPLKGLGIDIDGVTLDGIPFSQASSAAQLRTGVAIGLAGKPQCRVILIRDGSLLDESNLQALHDIATEHDAQVFLERVADSASPSAVFIEDGEVAEAEEPVTA